MSMKYRPDDRFLAYAEKIRQTDPAIASRLLIGPLDPGNLRRAVECMRNGGVIVFFSAMTYGIACNATSRAGVEAVYRIKGRAFDKPLPVLGSKESYERWVDLPASRAPAIRALIETCWPGGVSLIMPKARTSSGEYVIPDFATGGAPSVSLMCMDDVSEALAHAAGFPIAATSANLSGEPSIVDPVEAVEIFGKSADLLLLGTSSEVGVNTTIVDLTSSQPKLVRPGPVTAHELRPFLPDLVGRDDARFR